MICVYKNRGNAVEFLLEQDGETVLADAVTRAVFRFGDNCLDTNGENSELIDLIENSTRVRMYLGLIPNLNTGSYLGRLTIYDAEATEGLAWGGPEGVRIRVYEWQACEE